MLELSNEIGFTLEACKEGFIHFIVHHGVGKEYFNSNVAHGAHLLRKVYGSHATASNQLFECTCSQHFANQVMTITHHSFLTLL